MRGREGKGVAKVEKRVHRHDTTRSTLASVQIATALFRVNARMALRVIEVPLTIMDLAMKWTAVLLGHRANHDAIHHQLTQLQLAPELTLGVPAARRKTLRTGPFLDHVGVQLCRILRLSRHAVLRSGQ